MEKLSKLLNEYLESKEKDIQQFMNIATLMTQSDSKLYQIYIISKDFGFIKRLVEKDMIDLDKINILAEIVDLWKLEEYKLDLHSWIDSVMMILAIQDKPIDFLISILK